MEITSRIRTLVRFPLLIAAVLHGASSSTAIAQDSSWTGAVAGPTVNDITYGYWMDNGNWDNGYWGPRASFNPTVGDVGYPVLMNEELWVSEHGPSTKMGSLVLTGGTIQLIGGVDTFKTPRVGAAGRGVFTQTGGNLYMNLGEFRIGMHNNIFSNPAANGLYTISGGTFSTVDGNPQEVNFGGGGNIVLTRNQYSAKFEQAEFRISGDARVILGQPDRVAQALRFGGGNGDPNSSILSVYGPDATIDIWGLEMDNASGTVVPDARNGLIRFSFDETGPSVINLIGEIGDTAQAMSPSGIAANLTRGYLDIDYTGGPLAAGTSFTLMQATNTGKIRLDPLLFGLREEDTSNWSLSLTEDDTKLVLDYISASNNIVINVPSETQTQAQAGHAAITTADSVTKIGAGTVVFDAANSYTGPTLVSAGTLRVTNNNGLSATAVTVETGGTLALPQDARVTVAVDGLAVDQAVGGGLVDLGGGQVSIAAGGITASDLRADIIAGRNGGAWNGTTGISSSAAAASGGTRAVGYLVAGDGSARVSLAAPGDNDLNGSVNVFDLVSINSSGKYGTGTSSDWSQGDFNYDGVTNVFDLVNVNSAGAYGQGNYFPAALPTGLGSVASVPEPTTWTVLLATVGAAAAMRRRLQRR